MKYYRFYREHDSLAQKRRKEGNGNVVAVFTLGYPLLSGTRQGRTLTQSAVGAVLFTPNSPVASTAVGLDYLRQRCTRISEAEARRIHPRLFAYLDGDDTAGEQPQSGTAVSS